MINILIKYKKLYFILFFWVLLGVFTGPLAYLLIPVHAFFLGKRKEWLLVFLGIWFILTLSDSRQAIFQFAQTAKVILMVAVGGLVLISPKTKADYRFFMPFLVFFLVAFVAWFESPVPLDSFFKMASYVLLLLVIPYLIHRGLDLYRELFLFHLIGLGSLVLAIGLILRLVYPQFVVFSGGRYSGLLGNPNGLAIYIFMFFALVSVILHFYPYLLSRTEKWGIYGLIFISLVLTGSRGGIFSTAFFAMGWFLIQKYRWLGVLSLFGAIVSYQLILSNIEVIADALGLEAFLRIETLSTGSGRLVARDFAWNEIQNQYWMGKGFGYTEYFMELNKDYFLTTEHQGNVHNSYLTIWLDTGLVGLIAFCIGWFVQFRRASRHLPMVWALMFALFLSTSVESWLAASLNPFTIQLVTLLSLLSNPLFCGGLHSHSQDNFMQIPSAFK